MGITTNQTYEMRNVISYRGKLTEEEIVEKITQLKDFAQSKRLEQSGYLSFVIFSEEIVDMEIYYDIELFFPTDKACRVPRGFEFKPLFILKNAAKITHSGALSEIPQSMTRLRRFIDNNGLMPASKYCSVIFSDLNHISFADLVKAEVYVEVMERLY